MIRVELPPRTLDEVVAAYPAYRQSLLSTADNCALSTRFDLEGVGYTNAAQARGIIFHRFAAELLRTLRRTGERTIPTEEAMQILLEVSRQQNVPPGEIVVVPARERRLLRIAALKLAATELDLARLIAVEEQLETTLSYPGKHGGTVYRRITGRPDALISDPPLGAIVLDWKTAPSAPAAGDQPHWTGDHLHVSYGGYFQQRVYALLVMRTYPSVEQVTLREFYVLKGEAREAKVPREALEHIEAELGVIAEFLDRALMGGSDSPLWAPSPGTHCGYCRRPTDCPIEAEARVAQGGITSAEQAERVAAEVAVASEVRDNGLSALKAYHDQTGHPIPVKNAKGRSEWRWGEDSKGKRRFKMHAPQDSDRGGDAELGRVFAEAEQRKATA